MATIGSLELIMAILCFIFLHSFPRIKGHPWNWPLIGMLPICFPIFGNIFDNVTNVLERTKGTFVFNGPWFGKRNMIMVTSNPENLKHIMSSNFSNYPKGPDTELLFGALGKTVFATDHDEWRKQRKIIHTFFNNQRMKNVTTKVNKVICENGLIPVLDHVSKQGLVLDLQDVFKRFFLDSTCMIVTGYDHGSLRVGLQEDNVLKALHDINEGILMRHILPQAFWKLQKWLGFGKERKLQEAFETLDKVATNYLKRRRNEEFRSTNFFPLEVEAMGLPDKSTLDMIKSILFAGIDTTGSGLIWFFWHVLENPVIESKIRKEIEENLSPGKDENRLFTHPEELNKLVYLHATLLESMRLYPAVPFLSRTSTRPDILPSGHHVNSVTRIAVSCYAMGRMESIWGEDCFQFKPERFISNKGSIIPVAAHKFVAFSSGPRICPGKEIGLNEMKAVAATIMHNYDIQIVKNHPVIPATSIITEMKYGLKARISKRWVP